MKETINYANEQKLCAVRKLTPVSNKHLLFKKQLMNQLEKSVFSVKIYYKV